MSMFVYRVKLGDPHFWDQERSWNIRIDQNSERKKNRNQEPSIDHY